MNNRPRMGELLGEIVPLSGHDVEEILSEQHTTNRRFGEIALSWGLCQPQDVWSAWCRQVEDVSSSETVDLDRVGIDAQAVALLPTELAHTFRAMPIRTSDAEVVVASDAPLSERAREELGRLLKKHVKFVIATKQQIDAAIEVYYAS
jgi:type IV pilus assembly protein PilB